MYTVLSLHYGFGIGGVAKYATFLEKVSDHCPVKIRTLCIRRSKRFVDHETLAKLDASVIEQKTCVDLSWFRQSLNVIEEHHPDALMVHGFNGYVIGIILNRFLRKKLPLFCSNHGRYYAPSAWKYPLVIPYNLIAEYVLRNYADAIVTVCKYSKDSLIQKGIPSELITVIHNGIPVERGIIEERNFFRTEHGIKESDIVIGCVSRLDQEKGVGCLLEAFHRVASDNHDMRLIVIGTGSMEKSLRRTVQKNGLERRVILTGFRSDVENFLNAFDIFVLPSFAENHSISLLEAMRAGLAIIATNVGGNPESIRDRHDGIVVPPKDISALVEAVKELSASHDLRLKYGRSARKRFLAEFTEEVMIGKTAEWLQESITKVKARTGAC